METTQLTLTVTAKKNISSRENINIVEDFNNHSLGQRPYRGQNLLPKGDQTTLKSIIKKNQ